MMREDGRGTRDATGAPTAEQLLAEVRRLEIMSRRLVRDALAGEYSSAFKGRGVEIAELREYQYGDDVRTIDWRVTARTGSAHVRRYVEERELTALFLVDHSASNAFGSRRRTKAGLATEVCAVLAMAAERNNDRVGAVMFTDRVEQFVTPDKGRRHALRVIREFLAFRPERSGTDVAAALEFTNRVQRRRSVVFVVSDWMTTGYEPELELSARRHDVIAVQLIDPRERELPDVGLLMLRDPETHAWYEADSSDPRVRARFRERATHFDAELAQSLRRRGVDLIRLETGRDYVPPLLAFFRARERMRVH